MMKRNKRMPEEGRKIEKAEDNEWNDWFSHLSVEEHEEMLSKLGFSKEELEEWVQEVHIKKEQEKNKKK